MAQYLVPIQANVNGPNGSPIILPPDPMVPLPTAFPEGRGIATPTFNWSDLGSFGMSFAAIGLLWFVLELMASVDTLQPLAVGLAGLVAFALTFRSSSPSLMTAIHKLGF